MFRSVINFVIDLGVKTAMKIVVATYQAIYGNEDFVPKSAQTTNQPLPKAPEEELPLVLFGGPLTKEEWEMVKNADRTYLN